MIQLDTVHPVGYGVSTKVIHIPPASLNQARLVMIGDQAQHSAGFQIQIKQINRTEGVDQWLEFEPSVLRGSEGKELVLPPGTYKITRLSSTVPCGCAVNLGTVMLSTAANKAAPEGLTLYPMDPDKHSIGGVTSDNDNTSGFSGGLGVLPAAAIAYGVSDGAYRQHKDHQGPPAALGYRINPVLSTEHTYRQHVTATVDDIWVQRRVAHTDTINLPHTRNPGDPPIIPGTTPSPLNPPPDLANPPPVLVNLGSIPALVHNDGRADEGHQSAHTRYSWLEFTVICVNQHTTGQVVGPTTGTAIGTLIGPTKGNIRTPQAAQDGTTKPITGNITLSGSYTGTGFGNNNNHNGSIQQTGTYTHPVDLVQDVNSTLNHHLDINLWSVLDHHTIRHTPIVTVEITDPNTGAVSTKLIPINTPVKIWGVRQHRREPAHPETGQPHLNDINNVVIRLANPGPHPVTLVWSVEAVLLGTPS